MKRIERKVHINAPVTKVFDYVTDPDHIPEWLTSMDEVHDVKGDKLDRSFEWTYRMAGVKLAGKSEVTQYKPNVHYTTASHGKVESKWDYSFVKTKDGGTDLYLVVEYEVPVPVLGKLAEPMLLRRNEREADLSVANIKDMLEGGQA